MNKVNMNLFFIFVMVILVLGTALYFCPKFYSQTIYAQNDLSNSSKSKVEKIWETLKQLKNPESIAIDSHRNILYVSNVDGKPDDKDKNGFISKISATNGRIINLNWISGLDAPKGIDFDNKTGKLYVSDITNLIEIDTLNGKITNKYAAFMNSSLNDVIVDKNGNVFVSDPPNNAIFLLLSNSSKGNSNSLQLWLKSKELNGPNGLAFDSRKNFLVIASMGKGTPEAGGTLKAVDITNKKIINIGQEGITVPFGILDGLQISSDGKYYYVSDWNAKNIHVVESSGKGYHQLLNSSILGIADFKYVDSKKEFVIPIMPENKIVDLRIK